MDVCGDGAGGGACRTPGGGIAGPGPGQRTHRRAAGHARWPRPRRRDRDAERQRPRPRHLERRQRQLHLHLGAGRRLHAELRAGRQQRQRRGHRRRGCHGERRAGARLGDLLRREHHRLLGVAPHRAHHRGAGGDHRHPAGGDRAPGDQRPGAEAARVHPRHRGHPERPLRLQLQHPRLQQLAQPAHPHPDRRPRPVGAVPRLPGVGGGVVPARRPGQRRAGARPRLRPLRRRRLQRRAQHGDQGAALLAGRQDPGHRRRPRHPALRRAGGRRARRRHLLQGHRRPHGERGLLGVAQRGLRRSRSTCRARRARASAA